MASKVQIQIQIVTYNSRKHLERLFSGIEKQKGVDFEILIIDNASEDGSAEWIASRCHSEPRYSAERNPLCSKDGSASFTAKGFLNFADEYTSSVRNDKLSIQMTIIKNYQNLGFARAHNQGFAMCKAPYVLILNPDTELQDGFLSECLNVIESDHRIGSVGGVLYQELPKHKKNGVIDSLGMKMTICGQILDIGQNTRQKPNFSPKTEVFGITGACALYRLSALKQVHGEHRILDERFGLYSLKDDADLAWRLKRAGFKAKIALKAIAYHARGTGKGDERKNRSDQVKQTSIRNHLLMLKKNLSLRDWWRMPFIIAYEFVKFIYVLLFETRNLKAYNLKFPSLSRVCPRDSNNQINLKSQIPKF